MACRVVRALCLGCALAVSLPPPALRAQTPETRQLRDIERALERDQQTSGTLAREAERLARELAKLQADSVTAARQAQDLESDLTDVEATLAVLQAEADRKSADLAARRAQLGETLAALQRLALQPPEAMIASPGEPLDNLHSAMLLAVAVPALEERAALLRDELAGLTELHLAIAARRDEMVAAAAQLDRERDKLAALVARKQALQAKTQAAQAATETRVAALAGQAADLRDLVARLEADAREAAERQAEAERLAEAERRAEAERLAEARRQAEARQRAEAERQAAAARPAPAPPPPPTTRAPQQAALPASPLGRPPNIRSFPDTPGSLLAPARGPVVLRYGERGRGGAFSRGAESSKGIVIATRPGAQVVAPFDGKVAYAGPFRGYGLILIIEHDGRYHSLLAGMDRLTAIVGQWVLAGEPIGVMGAPDGLDPELYLELRRSGQPVNPLPWLSESGNKARG